MRRVPVSTGLALHVRDEHADLVHAVVCQTD